ncbi:MAG: diversity-generating retroelement protein Avd [Synechococcus sp.]
MVQKTYDFIKWYVPILNRLPRSHKYVLGDRIVSGLYTLLEGLIRAHYSNDKLHQLRTLNTELEVLRYQTRLLLDFQLISLERYEYAAKQMNEVGIALGGWIGQQQNRK